VTAGKTVRKYESAKVRKLREIRTFGSSHLHTFAHFAPLYLRTFVLSHFRTRSASSCPNCGTESHQHNSCDSRSGFRYRGNAAKQTVGFSIDAGREVEASPDQSRRRPRFPKSSAQRPLITIGLPAGIAERVDKGAFARLKASILPSPKIATSRSPAKFSEARGRDRHAHGEFSTPPEMRRFTKFPWRIEDIDIAINRSRVIVFSISVLFRIGHIELPTDGLDV